jgi:V/A-type H+-transporting ATPase subunit I
MLTTRMVKLFAAVLDHDADKVTQELLRLGVMQFVDIAEVKREHRDSINDVNPEVSLTKIAEIRRRIEGFLSPLGIRLAIPEEIDIEHQEPVNLEEVNRKLDRIADELETIREKQRNVQQDILRFEDIHRQVETHGGEFSDTAYRAQYSFISFRMGKVTREDFSKLANDMKDIPSVIIPAHQEEDVQGVMLVFMKRDTERVEKILREVAWTDVQLTDKVSTLKPDIISDLRERIAQLQTQQEEFAIIAKESVEHHKEGLLKLWVQLRVNELFSRIQSYFKRSSRTVIFSGWLPASKQTSIEEAIVRVTEGRCFLDWYHPEKDTELPGERTTVPVQLRNPPFMKPFQMLVTNFGVPEYGTIDPTFFVMISYLTMFGLMFADMCQGAVLVLVGLLGTFFFKPKKEGLQNLFKLIVWCGASSMVTGVLFGSYFGMAWLKPLWFDFHGIIAGHPEEPSYINSIFDILKITIYFGIGIIGIGLLFNWVNLSFKRRWADLILDKRGLLGGWFYFGGIYIARYMILHEYRSLPSPDTLFLLVGIPALLLFVKAPVHFISSRKQGSGRRFTLMTPMDFAMEWIVELLELFSGYLSNTLSFMRVAGLGIAHATLMISFFELARMANPSYGFSPWSILILVFGNILVIGLEGLTAGIQALRLNYYEFFSKFFRGSGEVYSPVSLRSSV